jgi:UDPglucose 6-dehydrogenase
MKVTFINQVADLCEKTGGNVQEVARAIGMDNRIGSKFLHAGPGFGGSCFPKDTRAFAATGKKYDAPQSLIEEVISVNEARKQAMAERIVTAARESGANTVAVLGVAFKPNTDDIRESPSLDIIAAIQKAGLSVRAHDPEAMDAAKAVLPDVTWCSSAYEAAKGAGVVALLTEWNAYRALDLKRVANAMEGNVLIDLRNVYKADDVAGTGLDYRSVGRTLKIQ